MRGIYFICFFLFIGLGYAQKNKTTTDTTRTLDPAADLYKASMKLIDSLRYKEAIKLLEKAVKIKKDNPDYYNKLALCDMQLNDFSAAQ